MDSASLALALQRDDIAVECVASTGSTNADLLARARAAVPAQTILRAAMEQTSGRGRLGRRWLSSSGGALLFSLALPWQRELATTAPVTLACGLAVAGLLRARGLPARVKWPNDIQLDGRKLAGILTELAEAPGGERTLVVGMGLNLFVTPDDRSAIGQPVAELAEWVERSLLEQNRSQWLADCAGAMLDAARAFERAGFAPLQGAYTDLLAYRDAPVQVSGSGGVVHEGVLRGVDAGGQLLLERAGRLEALLQGELSLRAAPGLSEAAA